MKELTTVFLCVFLFTLISCNSKHEKTGFKVIENNLEEEEAQPISYSEFMSFWDEFKDAIIRNDTSKLSSFIDKNLNGYCSSRLDVSKICKINFERDSTITKDRFVKEFFYKLNPIYIELLKDSVEKKDFGRNQYGKIVSNKNYHLMFGLTQSANNENATVIFCYGNFLNYEESIYEESINMRLLFSKSDNQIKLSEIDCYYLRVDE